MQNDDYILQNLYTGTLLLVQSIASSPLRVALQGASKPNYYLTGDYWLIPARTATGNIEWPQTPATTNSPASPIAKPPDGITMRHYYRLRKERS
jgi:hypothetical protein